MQVFAKVDPHFQGFTKKFGYQIFKRGGMGLNVHPYCIFEALKYQADKIESQL